MADGEVCLLQDRADLSLLPVIEDKNRIVMLTIMLTTQLKFIDNSHRV
jgi:hypothetical protein